MYHDHNKIQIDDSQIHNMICLNKLKILQIYNISLLCLINPIIYYNSFYYYLSSYIESIAVLIDFLTNSSADNKELIL